MTDTATQKGAAVVDPDVNPDEEIQAQANPRQAQLEAMAERQEAARAQELQEALEADPGLAMQQAAIEKEIDDANAKAGIVHEKETLSFGSNDGAASREPMHTEKPPAEPDLPSQLQDDPMADFIEMYNGQPMVKAKVNGEERLIPLADAKRQVQIGVAAEVRMQNAAEMEQRLLQKEKELSASEAALQARMNEAQSQPATPSVSQEDLSDENLEAEAIEIFETAFSGTEEDAAKKLARTLAKIRNSAAAQQPTQVDSQKIAQEAASLAVGTITQQSRQKDVQKGFNEFQANYPEIMADPALFKMADDLTETIEQEHPDWDVVRIMDEAGKRTQAWVKNLRGEQQNTDEESISDSEDQNSPVADQSIQNRLERKAELVKMPSAAASAQHSEPKEEGEPEQSPTEAFLELKKARGQPV